MKAFQCLVCGQLLFFENTVCLRCETEVGFDPLEMEVFPVGAYFRCANAGLVRCNWLVRGDGDLCAACRLTRTLPTPSWENDAALVAAETAKRRLVYQLWSLGLPMTGWMDMQGGLAFDFLSSKDGPVTTGHAGGVITIDLAESDDAHREAIRQQLGEPYRTMLGHLRHEIAHYYWPILIEQGGHIAEARRLFGDERADYAAALQHHYEQGPPSGWQDGYVSAYATAHPWEDWAETFAHYLHIRATLQTADAFGAHVDGPAVYGGPWRRPDLAARPAGDERLEAQGFDQVLDLWLPLTYALNAINRSMGSPDLYPFVLSAGSVAKLTFVHDLIRGVLWSGVPQHDVEPG